MKNTPFTITVALWDNNSLSGEVKSIPSREQISENIKEQLIVELYSK